MQVKPVLTVTKVLPTKLPDMHDVDPSSSIGAI